MGHVLGFWLALTVVLVAAPTSVAATAAQGAEEAVPATAVVPQDDGAALSADPEAVSDADEAPEAGDTSATDETPAQSEAPDSGDEDEASGEDQAADGDEAPETDAASGDGKPQPDPAARRRALCELLMGAAGSNDVPADFFIRLIWKESRFNPNAVSPVGAQGIAQFMPYTARAWGLSDPFDPNEALPASASFLRMLSERFGGHWGLAAMAYNAGADRVTGFLNGGFLPYETRDYVYAITGRTADYWRLRRKRELEAAAIDRVNPHPPLATSEPSADKPDDPPLILASATAADGAEGAAGSKTGDDAAPTAVLQVPTVRPEEVPNRPVDCEALVIALGNARTSPRPPGGGGWAPWGAQIAGHINRSVAMRQYARARAKLPGDLRGKPPIVVAKRIAGRGRRAVHAVQLGASSRAAAQSLCQRISASGAACVVVRN